MPLIPRLRSRTVPAVLAAVLAAALHSGAARAQGTTPCVLCDIADRVDRGPIESLVRGLSGADSVTLDGRRIRINTRSSLHPGKDIARDWLLEQVRAIGFEPSLQRFVLTVYHPDQQGAVLSAGGDTLLCGDDEGKIYLITAQGGWLAGPQASEVPARVYDLRRDGYGTIWAACKTMGTGYGELHRSADGGRTWEPYLVGGAGNLVYSLSVIDFCGPDAAVAAGSFGTVVVIQRAAGEWFWHGLDPSLFLYRQINGAGTSGPLHIWLTADGGALFESADLGGSWTTHALTTHRLWDVDFFDTSHGVVVGDQVVFHTVDGGSTWQQTAFSGTLRTVDMTGPATAIAGGDGGAIWRTVDGGVSWTQISPVCSRSKDVVRIIAPPGGQAWAVGRDEALRFDPLMTGDCATTLFADTLWGANIVFSLEGKLHPDRTVVVCSHYDSRNSGDPDNAPGADDNGSGTGAALEAARVLRDISLERTVEFVFFDGEEIGLLGSRHYVDLLPPFDHGVAGVINLDMIGRDYGGDARVEIAGRPDAVDTQLVSLVIETSSALGLDLDPAFLTDRLPMSDHVPFRDLEGVPAILLIEGEYWNNPHYHSASDIAGYCDFDFVTEIARAATVSAVRLAGLISVEPIPDDVVLYQSFPNPMWGDARIRFDLPERVMTELTVYDAAGRRVRTLMKRTAGPGPGEYAWDGTDDSGRDLASGVYFLRLRAGAAERTCKIVILR
jgi:hypothetical protein